MYRMPQYYPRTPKPCFTPFFFNVPWRFKQILNPRSLIFGLTSFISFTFIYFLSYGNFIFYLSPLFQERRVGLRGLGTFRFLTALYLCVLCDSHIKLRLFPYTPAGICNENGMCFLSGRNSICIHYCDEFEEKKAVLWLRRATAETRPRFRASRCKICGD